MQLDEYRKLAEVEDQMWYFRALNRRILHSIKSLRGKPARILDAGCGTGGLVNSLQQTCGQWMVDGLDFSAMACDLARSRTSATITQGSITDLPFENGSFDAVVSADVICQVEDGLGAFKEFARVIRPGGILAVNVPAYRWLWSYHDISCETKQRYRRSELRCLCEAAGLHPRFTSYANMLVLPLILIRRKVFPPKAESSDVRTYPMPLDFVCSRFADLEHMALCASLPLPLGTSVYLVATRQ